MPVVYLRDDRQEPKDIDIALRKLKKSLERCGWQKELQKREQYTKPSVLNRQKKNAAARRAMKQREAAALEFAINRPR